MPVRVPQEGPPPVPLALEEVVAVVPVVAVVVDVAMTLDVVVDAVSLVVTPVDGAPPDDPVAVVPCAFEQPPRRTTARHQFRRTDRCYASVASWA
jgi:hypothetical protein